MTRPKTKVDIGKIVGVYGLQGWLKLHSYCEPRTKIFEYKPLYIGTTRFEDYDGKQRGKGLLLRIRGLDDRTAVEHLVNCTVSIEREQLASLHEGEYYWHDLAGLVVMNMAGDSLGRVEKVIPTGANDVLVVQGDQRVLIPFVPKMYIKDVDFTHSTIRVDWAIDWV